MEEAEKIIKKPADSYAKIIIAQCICVGLIIITVLVTKYFFGSTYRKIKKWYDENICVSTDVNEVLEEDYEV